MYKITAIKTGRVARDNMGMITAFNTKQDAVNYLQLFGAVQDYRIETLYISEK